MRLLLLIPLLLAASANAPVRTVERNVLASDKAPQIKIKVDDAFHYLGSFHFAIRDVAEGDRYVWVDAGRDKRVRRLVIVQLEGFLEGKGKYNYQPRNLTHLGENDYNSNGFFYDDTAYEKENPGNEATKTRKFLEERGYEFNAEQGLYRFYRSLPDDFRNEILIFYIEDMNDLGLKMAEMTEEQETPREKGLVAAMRGRALKSFQIVQH